VALALAGIAFVGVGPAVAAPPPGIALSHAAFRFIIAARPAAGYFTLTNTSAATRELVGATSPGCGMLMLHQSMEMGGVSHMMAVKGVAVPAHGKATFAPGGYHLMCMSPTAALRPGKSVPVTLTFKDGASLTAAFPVEGPAQK
jgi:copper(I)-binding protein